MRGISLCQESKKLLRICQLSEQSNAVNCLLSFPLFDSSSFQFFAMVGAVRSLLATKMLQLVARRAFTHRNFVEGCVHVLWIKVSFVFRQLFIRVST
jgi:hypothetical protein